MKKNELSLEMWLLEMNCCINDNNYFFNLFYNCIYNLFIFYYKLYIKEILY